MKSPFLLSASLTFAILLFLYFVFKADPEPGFPSHLGPAKKCVKIDWNGFPHKVNETTAVNAPYAPGQVRFGTPTVRERLGPLDDYPLELDPPEEKERGPYYSQISIPLAKKANAYLLECDLVVIPGDSKQRQDEFSLFFDGRGTHELIFAASGEIQTVVTPKHAPKTFGNYSPNQVIHIEAFLDLTAQLMTIRANGTELERRTNFGNADLKEIRFNYSDSRYGIAKAALDNIQVYSLGEGMRDHR